MTKHQILRWLEKATTVYLQIGDEIMTCSYRYAEMLIKGNFNAADFEKSHLDGNSLVVVYEDCRRSVSE